MIKREFLIALICITLIVVVSSFVYFSSIPGPVKSMTETDKAALVYNRAIQFLNKGDETNAISNFGAVAELFGHSEYAEMALRRLATIYLQKGDDDKAIFYYQWLLKSFPGIKDAAKIQAESESLSMKKLLSAVPRKRQRGLCC